MQPQPDLKTFWLEFHAVSAVPETLALIGGAPTARLRIWSWHLSKQHGEAPGFIHGFLQDTLGNVYADAIAFETTAPVFGFSDQEFPGGLVIPVTGGLAVRLYPAVIGHHVNIGVYYTVESVS
jgi:hypothetical protein